MKLSDFEGTTPLFIPEEFLIGSLTGWAILEGPMGGLQKRCSIRATGKKTGGVIQFEETWSFDDGHIDHFDWQISPAGDNRYSGTEPTLEGEARGECSGCAFHWVYTRNVPQKDGSVTKLNFDDWFIRIDERGVIVKGTAGRLGLPFATAYVTYIRD